jgi:hypothetical protein
MILAFTIFMCYIVTNKIYGQYLCIWFINFVIYCSALSIFLDVDFDVNINCIGKFLGQSFKVHFLVYNNTLFLYISRTVFAWYNITYLYG